MKESKRNMLTTILTCLEILLAFIFWTVHIALRGIPILVAWGFFEYLKRAGIIRIVSYSENDTQDVMNRHPIPTILDNREN